ncbi:hypothetical protein MGN01_45080 [Methylobacterium gnaphalii]|uniref:Methyltransferase FkbM domain-containing protein n=1 Tax=Methylobacterium gnaphalii TaxID=1010610 RepID=A0A512JS03_9HYPH|nr:hypothetical protein MGN01_45080 [Methylobacterium gnaphalii]GLS51385.1 hypothetical protein GCM10007885_42420 [Methylobacterium gnaphalii]
MVDVGANFGYYAIIFGSLVGWKGRLLAFEPEPLMFELLSENIFANWIGWARQVNAACSDKAGEIELMTSRARPGNTGVATPLDRPSEAKDFDFVPFKALTVCLDDELDTLDGRIDFMKIDVEGSEPLVLRGAWRAIANNRQIVVMMEWSPDQLASCGHEPAALIEELRSHGLVCSAIGWQGDEAPLEFGTLLEGAPYQNIVLRHSAP